MGIIAWIVLGLAAGLLASILVGDRRSRGRIVSCVAGVAGAVAGGWAAGPLPPIDAPRGIFGLPGWAAVFAGAAVSSLACCLVSGRSFGGPVGSRFGWVQP